MVLSFGDPVKLDGNLDATQYGVRCLPPQTTFQKRVLPLSYPLLVSMYFRRFRLFLFCLAAGSLFQWGDAQTGLPENAPGDSGKIKTKSFEEIARLQAVDTISEELPYAYWLPTRDREAIRYLLADLRSGENAAIKRGLKAIGSCSQCDSLDVEPALWDVVVQFTKGADHNALLAIEALPARCCGRRPS